MVLVAFYFGGDSMLEKAIEVFDKYVDNFDLSEEQISMKKNHSKGVMNLMGSENPNRSHADYSLQRLWI